MIRAYRYERAAYENCNNCEKEFFNREEIPHYTGSGATIGEYVILIPVARLSFEEKDGFKIDSLKETMKYAKSNDIYDYATGYMQSKYGQLS